MKIFLFILVPVILLAGGIGIWLLLEREPENAGSNDPVPTFPGTSGVLMVREPNAEEKNEITESFHAAISDSERLELPETAIVDDYALSIFMDENVGGMALFKQNVSGGWELVSTDGGVFNLEILIDLGVPAGTAQRLIETLD